MPKRGVPVARVMRLALLVGLPLASGVATFITSGRMSFGSCQDYCTALGAVVACVETDADQTMLNGLLYESYDCDQFWVGYTDTDGDGTWTWPYGCSSTRVYGECGDDAPCNAGYAGHCVTLNNDVAYCSESSQCCACSETESPAPTATPAPTPAPTTLAPTVTPAPTPECPSWGTQTASGKCLFVSEHYYDYAECQNEFCAPNGGVIACIEDDEENEAAKDLISYNGAWIGYNDGQNEGEWGWVSCSSEFTAWYSGEPNDWGGCEDCAVLENYGEDDDYYYYYKDSGSWNDLACNNERLCLCEYGGAPVSENFDAWALLEDAEECNDMWWWEDDDENCSREWCTKTTDHSGYWNDCWAGTPGEKCTCSRGEARETGNTHEDDGYTYCETRRLLPPARARVPLSPLTRRVTGARTPASLVARGRRIHVLHGRQDRWRGVRRLLRALACDHPAVLPLRLDIFCADRALVLLLDRRVLQRAEARHNLGAVLLRLLAVLPLRHKRCTRGHELPLLRCVVHPARDDWVPHHPVGVGLRARDDWVPHHPRHDGHRGCNAQAEADVVGPQFRRPAADHRAAVALRRHRAADDGPARCADDRADASRRGADVPRGHREHGGSNQEPPKYVLIGDTRQEDVSSHLYKWDITSSDFPLSPDTVNYQSITA